MIKILLKLIIYTVFILLTYTSPVVSLCFAIPMSSSTFIPKNVDEVFKCKQCCKYYDYTKVCDIFYNLCMTKTFKDGVFMFSRKNFTYQQAYDVAKQYSTHDNTINIILILVENNRVYFNKDNYQEFKEEVMLNIEKKDMQKLLKDVLTQIKLNLDYKDEASPNRRIKGSIYRNTYDNIYNISSIYVPTIKWHNKEIKPTIKLYYNGHKESCIKKLKPTKIAMLKTILPINSSFVTSYNKNTITTMKPVIINTLPINSSFVTNYNKNTITTMKPVIVNTLPINSSAANNNRLFVDVHQNPTSYKNVGEGSSNLIPITITAIATFFILVGVPILSIFVYKRYSRNKPKIDTMLEDKNKNEIAESMEHVYEDPYALPYNSIQLVIDDKNNDKSRAVLSESEEHVYIPCINNPDFKASNHALTDINNFGSNSSLHEQQCIITETENHGKTTPVYYTLEDSNIVQE